MKKFNLEPNEDNLLKSLLSNQFNRNSDLIDFIKILDSLDGNFFLALDGDWGTGKTFFVKHLEMLLSYDRSIKMNLVKSSSSIGNVLGDLKIKNIYQPIYYNAWLYDNHNDPVLSLIYNIVQNSKVVKWLLLHKLYNRKLNKDR